MADESDVLELDELAPDEELDDQDVELEGVDTDDVDAPEVDDDIRFEDEGVPPDPKEYENATIRAMRKQIEAQRKELAARPARQSSQRPTLEDCDYDEDAYSSAMQRWAIEQVATPAHDPAAELEATFNDAHARFVQNKNKMARPDYDVAVAAVEASLSVEQQSALLLSADDSAKLIYALGKSPAKLALLASHTNPIKLAAEVARLEQTLTTAPRRQPPPPADRLPGSSPSLIKRDAALERLERQADKSGNRTAVIAHKRKLREAHS